MRKVEYYKYQKVEGKPYYEKVKEGEGIFHQFGCDYEEFESGAGNFSTAIIELKDGTIINPPVENVKFLSDHVNF